MKNKQVLTVIIGVALVCGTALAQVGRPQGPGPRSDRPGGPLPEGEGRSRMQQRGHAGRELGRQEFQNPKRLKEAGATDQQLEALKKFAGEQQFKRIDLQAAAQKAELALEQQMRSETVDEKAALAAVDTLSQARAEIFKLEVSSKLKIREILGAEIQKKLCEMGPPEGAGHPARSPRPDGPARKEAPSAGDRR